MITFGGIVYGLNRGLLPPEVANAVDVGPSYGLYAVAALLIFRFSPPWRALSMGALITYLIVSAWGEPTFTAFGHLAAITIGFAMYPVIALKIRGLHQAAISNEAVRVEASGSWS